MFHFLFYPKHVLNHWKKCLVILMQKLLSGWRQQHQQMEGKKDREMWSGSESPVMPQAKAICSQPGAAHRWGTGPGASFPVYIPDSSQRKCQRLLLVFCLSSLSHKVGKAYKTMVRNQKGWNPAKFWTMPSCMWQRKVILDVTKSVVMTTCVVVHAILHHFAK